MLDEEEALSLLKAVFNRSNDSKKLTYTGMKKVLYNFLKKIELLYACISHCVVLILSAHILRYEIWYGATFI